MLLLRRVRVKGRTLVTRGYVSQGWEVVVRLCVLLGHG